MKLMGSKLSIFKGQSDFCQKAECVVQFSVDLSPPEVDPELGWGVLF